MINHIDIGRTIEERQKVVGSLIRNGDLTLGGYRKGKIYGQLNCSSGKRMKVENRVFFKDEAEALINGYRPCGHCMKEKYRIWKDKQMIKNRKFRIYQPV